MAKKIKFALDMADGAKVRTIEDLREHFDLEKATSYFLSGKLLEWLEDRYYDDEAEAVRGLDQSEANFSRRLCEALGAEYVGDDAPDVETLARQNEKRAKLRQLTDDESILAHAAQVAFTQEDLAELLDEGAETIYLCGKQFSVPARMENRRYIGILGKPEVKIGIKTKEALEKKGIAFENVTLPKELQEPTEERKTEPPALSGHKMRQSYHASKLLDFKMSDKDREQAAKMFDAAQDILGGFNFDIDAGSRPLLEAAQASNLRGGLQRYLERMA